VELWTDSSATASSLAEGAFDTIVCATGSRWDASGFTPYRPDRNGIPGAESETVLTIDVALEGALEDPRGLGERVLLLDESAGPLPLTLALLLRDAGVDVEIVTPHLFLGEDTQKTWDMNFLYPKLVESGVRMRPQHFVEEIHDGGVEIYNVWGGPRQHLEADAVVLSLMRLPEDSLHRELVVAGHGDVRLVGDAVAPRRLEAIVYEGEQLGREL
jgi:hypothetical protein